MSDYKSDWVEVVTLDNCDYSWVRLEGYWSPPTRRYFWYTDAGCSCNYWEDPDSAEEWSNGDRAALLREVDNFYTEYPDDKHEAKRAVRDFKETA